jgi:trigger factor
MDERDIRPIGEPSMVDMDYHRGERFTFKIQYEIRPEITLREYKGLRVEKPVHPVVDADVDAEILRIRKANSTTEQVSAVTDTEHVVTADIQELDPAGTPIIGRKAKDTAFYLADESLSKEIRAALKNAEAGGSYRTRLEPSEDGKNPALDVVLNVSKIDRVILPLFDEQLVEKITGGRTKTPDEFRQHLRSDLERYWSDWSERRLADTISSMIVKEHDFPVPESLVTTVLDSYLEDLRGRSRDRKLPKDFDEGKFRQESREHAVWQAKWILLKDKIAETEKISIGEDDIAKAAEKESKRIGLPADRMIEYYSKSSSARSQLLSKKVMDFLIAEAKVSEKEVLNEQQQ